MSQIRFFALKEDLLPVLELVESKGPLKYVLERDYLKRKIKRGVPTYPKGADIPNLGRTRYESGGDRFLVCERNARVSWKTFRGVGGVRVTLSYQETNPHSVGFTPGGLWKEDVVLPGLVGTISDSPIAQRLMRRFQDAIKKTFTKVRAYHVGPKALELLKRGARLTAAEQCPREYDLTLAPPKSKQPQARRKKSKTTRHLTYEESYRELQRLGYVAPGDISPLPSARPRDDEPCGVSFFRTMVAEDDLENLTLPRTFISRSEIGPISFKASDLSQSTLCWNEFNDVDFTDCDLSECDLRASIFKGARFTRAKLRNADLRHSHFKDCDFTDADMRGAKAGRSQRRQLRLSGRQREVEVDWQELAGDLPEGG